MPRVKLQNGSYKEIASPLDPTTQKMIDDAVIGEYEKVVKKEQSQQSQCQILT